MTQQQVEDLGVELKSAFVATEALDRIVHMYGKRVQSYFRKHIWGQTGSVGKEDLEQEVWTRLWEAARSCHYNPSFPVEVFLWGIAGKVKFEQLERIRSEPQQLPEGDIPQGTPDEFQDLSSGIPSQDLIDCLFSVYKDHPDEVITVLLVCYKGLTERKAAKKCRVSRSTVNDRKQAGLGLLQRCLRNKDTNRQIRSAI